MNTLNPNPTNPTPKMVIPAMKLAVPATVTPTKKKEEGTYRLEFGIATMGTPMSSTTFSQ
jgi:hypothetical protein